QFEPSQIDSMAEARGQIHCPGITATTEPSTLSLHDALPISGAGMAPRSGVGRRAGSAEPLSRPRPTGMGGGVSRRATMGGDNGRSEEHTSELQSQSNIVCRLLLEKKNRIEEKNGFTSVHRVF